MVFRIFVLFFLTICSYSLSAKKTSIVCTHPQVCNIVSTLVDFNEVQLEVGVKPQADPHAHEISSSEIKKLTQADIVISPGLSLQHWIKTIKRKRKKTTLVYKPSSNKKSHFWLYPNELCMALNYFSTELKKSIKIREDKSICRNQSLNKDVSVAFKKLKDKKIILTHDASEALFKEYNLEVISLKGSGHHDEVDIRSLKMLNKIQKRNEPKNIVWIIEKGIHIPASVKAKMRKDEIVVHVDILGAFNHAPHQILSSLIKSIKEEIK